MGFNAYTPAETIEIVGRAGVSKGDMRLDKVFFSSVSAGCLLSFACATALSTNSSSWYQENAPGLIRTLSALVFPYGLCTIVLTGADLCTGSFLFTTVAVLQRRLSIPKMLIHWGTTFFGNLAGSLFIVSVITGYGGTFASEPYKAEAIKFATTKQLTPEWHQIFLRGIAANWLVCLACYLGMSGRELFSKVVGIWWPTFAFVSLGMDHVVANMFFVPTGIWEGAPISVGLYIWKGIIPAFIGNVIGGSLMVATYYYYQYLQGQEAPVIDGVAFGSSSSSGTVDLGKRRVKDEEGLQGTLTGECGMGARSLSVAET